MKPRLIFTLYTYASLACLALLSSCKDIIEPSIAKRIITAEAPADNYQSTSYTVGFWWDEVEDALKYRLQVVSNTFDTPGALILDTVVTKSTFSATLVPGQYQWRVRAENGSTQTAYSNPRNLTVVFSSIKQQKVQLSSPLANLLTNQSSLTFSWGSLYGATKYRLEIDTNNFTNESAVVYNQVIPAQQLKYVLSKDQSYQWRVRAENDTAQSQWSTVGYFTYDHTPPDKVKLTSPVSGSSVSLPVSLKWNISAGAARYKMYVFQSDSTSTYNSSFPVSLTTSTYSFNLGNLSDRMYWRVTALDAAGNESLPSELRNFTLQ